MRWQPFVIIVLMSAAAFGDAKPAEHYAVIHQRSIFSKRRAPAPAAKPVEPTASVEAEAPAPPPKPVDPASLYRLVGVSLIGEAHVAFFEDTRDGSVQPAAANDTLAERRIVRIMIDDIVVTTGSGDSDAEHTIRIGQALSGDELDAPARTPSAAPAAGDDANLSILERLRRKREQEMNP